MIHYDKLMVDGKLKDRESAPTLGYPSASLSNGVWVNKTKLGEFSSIVEVLSWFPKTSSNGQEVDILLHNFYDWEIRVNDAGKNYLHRVDTALDTPGWFFIESADKELIERFKEDFEDIIVQDIDAESVKLLGPMSASNAEIYEYTNTFGPDFFGDPTRKPIPNIRWFAQTPYKIMDDLGFEIERMKVKNLAAFGSEDIQKLWELVSLVPEKDRREHGNEFVNFLLGPLAAELKIRNLEFGEYETVFNNFGMMTLVEAMSIGLIPAGSRKELYTKLLEGFNKSHRPLVAVPSRNSRAIAAANFSDDIIFALEASEMDQCHNYLNSETALDILDETRDWYEASEASAREVFYQILAEVVEPIFSAASSDDLVIMIKKVLAENPKQALAAKDDPKVVGWIMGAVMRASPTKLDPNTVRAEILKLL